MTFLSFSEFNVLYVGESFSEAAKFDGFDKECNLCLKDSVPLLNKSLLKQVPFTSSLRYEFEAFS